MHLKIFNETAQTQDQAPVTVTRHKGISSGVRNLHMKDVVSSNNIVEGVDHPLAYQAPNLLKISLR